MATPSKLSKYVDGFLGYAYVVIPKYKHTLNCVSIVIKTKLSKFNLQMRYYCSKFVVRHNDNSCVCSYTQFKMSSNYMIFDQDPSNYRTDDKKNKHTPWRILRTWFMHGQPKNKPRLNQKQDRWHKQKKHNPRNKKMQSPVTDIIIIITCFPMQFSSLYCCYPTVPSSNKTPLHPLSLLSLFKNYRRVHCP